MGDKINARNLMEAAGVPAAAGTRTPVTGPAQAVAGFAVEGPRNNLPFRAELLEHPEFAGGDHDTGLVSRMRA